MNTMKSSMTRMIAVTLIGCLALTSMASAEELWGVSHGTSGFWTGGQIWTIDTATGTTSLKASYDTSSLVAFGDIAVSPVGDIYVTTYTNSLSDFKTLAKVNAADWTFAWEQTLPVQMNSLTFVGNDLYLHAGGGAVDGLYKLAAADLNGTTAPTLVGNSGYDGSDGDLAYNAASDKMYNVFTPGSVGNLAEIDYVNGGATLVGTLNGTAKFGTTDGGNNHGWAGLEFDSQGKLWAGSYWENKLYSRPDLNAGSDVVFEYDLTDLGAVTGLSIAAANASNAPVTVTGTGGADAPTARWAGTQAGKILEVVFNLDSGNSMTFTSNDITASASSALEAVMASEGVDGQVSQVWDFDTAGYTFGDGESVALSFDVGLDPSLDNINLWHDDGSGWSLVDLDAEGITATLINGELTFSGVDDFSSYGVSVPEPATMSLLGLGGLAILRRRRRSRK